ncbi:MAG: Ldh family oxidoreductase, partial [Acidimicrobiia bacterium]|nr:Ldh family oxidoreductase [Acidimicrobiia bacterium]
MKSVAPAYTWAATAPSRTETASSMDVGATYLMANRTRSSSSGGLDKALSSPRRTARRVAGTRDSKHGAKPTGALPPPRPFRTHTTSVAAGSRGTPIGDEHPPPDRKDTCMWKVSPTRLEDVCTAIVRATGAPGSDARLVAEHLVENDVIGHHSHGVIRLWDYIDWAHGGDLIPGARPRVLGETPTTARVDGGWNFGQVVATFATGLAIEKARTAGVGVVTIRRVKHIGRLGRYAEQVAGEGLVSMIFTNGGGHGINQAPFRGTERRLCSNPLAMSVPSRLAGPFLLDMATSVAAEGKVRVYRARGTPTPTGWILDSDGNPTTDPEDFARGGALLPVGREEGHKGSALAFIVELLAGLMSGGC